MFIYHIGSGELTELNAGKTSFVGFGYSGLGEGKNNPRMIQVVGVGPIPPGHYTIGPAFTSPQSGPITMRLTPEEGTEVYGRSGFEMHGDSKEHPGQASHGCTIMPPWARKRVAAAEDREVLRRLDALPGRDRGTKLHEILRERLGKDDAVPEGPGA